MGKQQPRSMDTPCPAWLAGIRSGIAQVSVKKFSVILSDATMFIMLLASTSIIVTWTIVSLMKVEMQKLTPEQVAMLLGTMGLQAWQKRGSKE